MALILPSGVAVAGHKVTGTEFQQLLDGITQAYGIRGVVSVTQFINNSTTLTNVTGLSCALEANAAYRFYGLLFMASGTTGDIKIAATAPAGATGFVNASGSATTDTGTVSAQYMGANTSFTTAFPFGGSNLTVVIEYKGYIVTTSSGSYQIQYAQNTADAGANTTIWADSWITFWKD